MLEYSIGRNFSDYPRFNAQSSGIQKISQTKCDLLPLECSNVKMAPPFPFFLVSLIPRLEVVCLRETIIYNNAYNCNVIHKQKKSPENNGKSRRRYLIYERGKSRSSSFIHERLSCIDCSATFLCYEGFDWNFH